MITEGGGEVLEVREWHNKTGSEHVALRDAATKAGFRFQCLSLYGTPDAPLYGAVMIQFDPMPAQRDFPYLSLEELLFAELGQQAEGFAPVIIGAVGSAGNAAYAVVFESGVSTTLMPALLSGSYLGPSMIENAIELQKQQGMMLRSAASYGEPSSPQFAAIFQPQPAEPVMWDADGLLDSAEIYQQRYEARTSAWGRPYFVTANGSGQYLSAFVNDEVGGYWARHGIGAAELDSTYEKWTTHEGYTPVCIQGAGPSVSSASFSAIFVQNTTPTTRHFTATGPVANAGIDAVIEAALRTSPLRDAALAIVHGTQLVYARGYTLAEPGWPITQPTTFFRMASDSKTVTALAAYQKMQQDSNITLDTPIQSLLHLTTLSGAPPTDPRFSEVTIRHLLEHTSGIPTDAFNDGPAVLAALHEAGETSATLPVSRDQSASYVAGLTLEFDPGTNQAYNNCGYFLLGRILKVLASAPDAVTAYGHLFAPLQITRIRNAVSLLADQPADEARYQTYSNLLPGEKIKDHPLTAVTGESQLSDARPLVALEYGTEQIEILEGAGGLSAAVTDMARLAAITIDPDPNPALTRATINCMLKNAIACQQHWQSVLPKGAAVRAGHGWDAAWLENERYAAQKGGALASNHSVVQFNGDWGFVMVWAGSAYQATDWYPDYPRVMNIATGTKWTEDLFPAFGMPSL